MSRSEDVRWKQGDRDGPKMDVAQSELCGGITDIISGDREQADGERNP